MRRRVLLLASAALVLSGCASAAASTPDAANGSSCDGTAKVAGLNAEQSANASAIVSTALSLGAGNEGALVGVVTAITESTLNNVNYGDTMANGNMSSSRGLFQQLDAWGPLADRLDPKKSTTMFFMGGKAGQKGLLQIPGWKSMDPAQAAQAVQGSQFSDGSNYTGNLPQAKTVTDAIIAGCSSQPQGLRSTGGGLGAGIVNAAASQVGVPYSWGGGHGPKPGPSLGIHDGGIADSFGDYKHVGFDCSGLVRWAVYQATNGRVDLNGSASDLRSAGTSVPSDLAQMQPGDIIAFGLEHVGIYQGDGKMVDAPASGERIRVDSVAPGSYNGDTSTWSVRRIS